MPIPKLIVLGNFLKQRPTGVQRYAIELTRALSQRNPGQVTLLAPPGAKIPDRLMRVPVKRASCMGPFGRGLPGWSFFDAPTYLALSGVGDALVWNPSNIGAPHIPNQIITLHDLSFLRYPGYFSPGFRYKHQVACSLTLPKVLGVTTVSQASKGEIEASFPFLKGRVDVVYNGVSERFRRTGDWAIRAVREYHGLPERFFLSIGSLDPRKNLKALIAAYVDGRVLERTGLGLVVAGGSFSSFSRDAETLEMLRRPGVRHLGYVRDEELPALYSACHAFVLPSIYEGFGIPVIEALACGAPVLCSDIPVFREIGGSRVQYFPLNSEKALTDALVDAGLQPAPRGEGSAETSNLYSWDRAAESFEVSLNRFQPRPRVGLFARA